MTSKKYQRNSYTEEFKHDAVALVTEQGYTIMEATRSLGISNNLIGRWKREQEEIENGESLSRDERSELICLRKENRELKMEKEILKKASAFFAKEMK